MSHFQLSQSFNPSNQLSFKPFRPEQPSQSSPIEPKIEQLTQSPIRTIEDLTFYENQIKKLEQANLVIKAQLSSALEEKKIILDLISAAKGREANQLENEKEKRVRRSAKQIQRKHVCPIFDCQKAYGSQGSLVQHMRLKHPNTNTHDPPLINDPF